MMAKTTKQAPFTGATQRGAHIVLLLLAALLLHGCTTTQPTKPPVDDHAGTTASDVLFSALGLVGTPYRYGGNTPQGGFDCSGLIQYVYRQSADVHLPRTVAEMSRIDGPDIPAQQLQNGDLVIFASGPGSRPNHAGIYVGEGRFVHAPSKGGKVRLDNLGDKYWQQAFLGAKRPLASR